MPTTARGIWTPSDTDAVDFTTHLATMAGTIDTAITNGLNTVGAGANAYKGTAAQRTAFLSTAVNGMLWQDTDGIKMIWRKDGAVWVPAVWRWSGTTAQMTAFTQAPNGFEWFNTTDNRDYAKLGGSWVKSDTGWGRADTLGFGSLGTGWSHMTGTPYDGLRGRVKDGVLFLSGALQKSSTIVANDVFWNFAPGYVPQSAIIDYTYTASAGFVVAQPSGTWIMAFAGGTQAYVGTSFPIGS